MSRRALTAGLIVAQAPARKARAGYYKALTFKVDQLRYAELKRAGVELDLSSQDVLTRALDEWLARRR